MSEDQDTTLPTQTSVSRQYRRSGADVGKGEHSDETIKVDRFATTPAQLRIALGRTINLGNFESLRIDVSMTVPCYKEEADAAFEYASNWVKNRISEEAGSVMKGLGRSTSSDSDDPF
jgi:hypothetical protein